MKKVAILFLLFLFTFLGVKAEDTIFVRETRIPILIERQDYVLFYLRLNAQESQTLNDVVLKFGNGLNLSEIESVKLYYSGTEVLQDRPKKCLAPVSYISSHNPGKILAANPSYSILKANDKDLKKKHCKSRFVWLV